jgi:hypothetical protein
MLILLQIQIFLFSWVEETHVFLKRKPSFLEGTASSTFFQCENWVSFWRNTSCDLGHSRLQIVENRPVQLSWSASCNIVCPRWRDAHFVPKRPKKLSWRSICIFWTKTICVRSRSI